MRPVDAPVRLLLDVSPAALAAASVTCARAAFPVDAAVALCAEAASITGTANLGGVIDVEVQRAPAPADSWTRQLLEGCGWYENTLPAVVVPRRCRPFLNGDGAARAVAMAADPGVLERVRVAEWHAASSNRTLGELLAESVAACQA